MATYTSRIINRAAVTDILKQLKAASDDAAVVKGTIAGICEVFAPDGTLVFVSMKGRRDYLCRFNKEVFNFN